MKTDKLIKEIESMLGNEGLLPCKVCNRPFKVRKGFKHCCSARCKRQAKEAEIYRADFLWFNEVDSMIDAQEEHLWDENK